MTVLVSIGRHTILLELARGGMAQVFVALRDGTGETCVLKTLLEGLKNHEPVVRRFHREAEVASRLDHPNIAKLLEVGKDGGNVFLLMEYISGQTVESVLEMLIARSMRIELEIAIPILLAILDALEYAHALTGDRGEPLGLVHRDLSPKNVMIGFDGRVKIIDFGVARANIDDFQTEPGMLIGTLQYFSPEQAKGEAVDLRTDLYATAAVAYEMLMGRPLIRTTSPVDMLAKIIDIVPPPMTDVDPHVSREIERVIQRGLARDPAERFQSAKEMREAFLRAAKWSGGDGRETLAAMMHRLFPGAKEALSGMIAAAREGVEQETTEVVTQVDEPPPVFTETEYEQTELPEKTAIAATKILNVASPRRSNSMAAAAALALVLLAVMLGSALVSARFSSSGESPTVVRPAAPTIEPAPRAAAKVPDLEPAEDFETPAKAPVTAKRAPKARSEPPPPIAVVDPFDHLRRELARVRESPGDADLFQSVADAIAKGAESLAPEEKSKVRAAVDAATRSGDVEQLAKGLERLIAYSAKR